MNLVEQWQRLIDEEGTLPAHEADPRDETLHAATLKALEEDGEDRQLLLTAFRTTNDERLRYRLEGVLLPPSSTATGDPDGFRNHPEVGFSESVMPISVALGLPVADLLRQLPEFHDNPLAVTSSWYAGLPAVPRATVGERSIPRRSDGAPLTHVVQVDLAAEVANQGEDLFRATGLPMRGVVQLFHDLETHGEATDDPSAWRVMWMPETQEQLTLPDLSEVGDVPDFLPINAQTMATAPSVLDVMGRLSETEGDRYARARDWLEQTPSFMNAMALVNTTREGTLLGGRDNRDVTPWDESYEPPFPVSRMGGFPYAESNPDYQEVLAERLPLSGDDHYVLLFDISPMNLGKADVWFHGGRNLEVWIRRSDLRALNFADAWALIRTDA